MGVESFLSNSGSRLVKRYLSIAISYRLSILLVLERAPNPSRPEGRMYGGPYGRFLLGKSLRKRRASHVTAKFPGGYQHYELR